MKCAGNIRTADYASSSLIRPTGLGVHPVYLVYGAQRFSQNDLFRDFLKMKSA